MQPNTSLVGSADGTSQNLPFKAYEQTFEIKDRTSRSVFVEAAYNVETGEAERIAVDWTAKGGGTGTSCEYTSLMIMCFELELILSGVASTNPTRCCENATRQNLGTGPVCYQCHCRYATFHLFVY